MGVLFQLFQKVIMKGGVCMLNCKHLSALLQYKFTIKSYLQSLCKISMPMQSMVAQLKV